MTARITKGENPPKTAEDSVHQELRGAALVHGHPQRQHSENQKHDVPLHCAVGLIGGQATEQNHRQGRQDRQGHDGKDLGRNPQDKPGHHTGADPDLPRIERRLRRLADVDELPGFHQFGDLFGGSFHQQSIAEVQFLQVEVVLQVHPVPVIARTSIP